MDVQYGKTEGNTQYPVFGIAAPDEDLDTIRTTLKKKGIDVYKRQAPLSTLKLQFSLEVIPVADTSVHRFRSVPEVGIAVHEDRSLRSLSLIHI